MAKTLIRQKQFQTQRRKLTGSSEKKDGRASPHKRGDAADSVSVGLFRFPDLLLPNDRPGVFEGADVSLQEGALGIGRECRYQMQRSQKMLQISKMLQASGLLHYGNLKQKNLFSLFVERGSFRPAGQASRPIGQWRGASLDAIIFSGPWFQSRSDCPSMPFLKLRECPAIVEVLLNEYNKRMKANTLPWKRLYDLRDAYLIDDSDAIADSDTEIT